MFLKNLTKRKFFKSSLYACVILCSAIAFTISYAEESSKTVNILTWWGYLSTPEITNTIKNQCNVKISYDEYYTNNEFLRRMKDNKTNYDIIIFSNAIYNLIKNQIPKSNIDLSIFSDKFNTVIRKNYLNHHYPKNIIYFMHSLTGFLWNPKLISLNEDDNIQDIFKKAGKNTVVVLDDPIEVWNLVNRGRSNKKFNWSKSYEKSIPLNKKNFNSLTQNSNIYITNKYNKVFNRPDFAFSFDWSGEAIAYIKQSKTNFKFLIHPKLSYISTDLLATLSNNQNTKCVAKILMSKKVANILQNNTYYLSPYGELNANNDPLYQSVYSSVLANLKNIVWLQPLSPKNYKKMLNSWAEIQLQLRDN